MAKQEQRPWHHLFGLSWMDLLRGTGVAVEPEKDLSEKKQLLDLAILRPQAGPLPRRLPDGFELAEHNLVTFKSYQEALDADALEEVVGHGVNYRKQVSPSMQALLPREQFRLFAVCVRYPHNLMQALAARPVRPGVYDIDYLTRALRLVVIHELPKEEHNAMLLLFSARADLVEYAARHYRPRSPETSTLLLQFVRQYREEGIAMPETLEEFARRARQEVLEESTPEERVRGLSLGERLTGVSEEDLRRLSPEARAELLRLTNKAPADPAN